MSRRNGFDNKAQGTAAWPRAPPLRSHDVLLLLLQSTSPRPHAAAPPSRHCGWPPPGPAITCYIHRLLVSVFHGPSAAEFHAQLDEPGYEPADRLVVKDGEQVAAHLRLARQTIQLGAASDCPPPGSWTWRRRRNIAAGAWRRRCWPRASGPRPSGECCVGLTRTRVPELFARQGWAVCGRHFFSAAPPRAVLAELAAAACGRPMLSRACDPPRRRESLQERIIVRPLRRIELPAIVRLYEQNLAGQRGWPCAARPIGSGCWPAARATGFIVAATGPRASRAAEAAGIDRGLCFRPPMPHCRGGRGAGPRRRAPGIWPPASAPTPASRTTGSSAAMLPPDHPLHELFRRAGGECHELPGAGGRGVHGQAAGPAGGAASRRPQPCRAGPRRRIAAPRGAGN